MKNLSHILGITTLAFVFTACQAQYKTNEGDKNNNPTAKPASSTTLAKPEPVRSVTPGSGGSIVKNPPRRTPPPAIERHSGGSDTQWGDDTGGGNNSSGNRSSIDYDKLARDEARATQEGTVDGGGSGGSSRVQEDTYVRPDPTTTIVTKKPGICYCQEHNQNESVMKTAKVDILFLVDPSVVSSKEREQIAGGIDGLLHQLPKDTDYNIGVIPAVDPSSKLAGALYAPGTESKVLNSTASTKAAAMSESAIHSSLVDRLAGLPTEASINKISAKSDTERGFSSLLKALTDDQFMAFMKTGMIRKDAALAIIIVGGARDGKGVRGNKVAERLKQIKRDMPVSVNGILLSDETTIDNQGGFAYLDLIRQSNGRALQMGRRSASEEMAAIGENIYLGLFSELDYLLKDNAQYRGEEINVYVDGVKQPKSLYRYDLTSHHVFVHSAGRIDSKIKIEFCKN